MLYKHLISLVFGTFSSEPALQLKSCRLFLLLLHFILLALLAVAHTLLCCVSMMFLHLPLLFWLILLLVSYLLARALAAALKATAKFLMSHSYPVLSFLAFCIIACLFFTYSPLIYLPYSSSMVIYFYTILMLLLDNMGNIALML